MFGEEQLVQIAESMTAKEFFLAKEASLLDTWERESLDAFMQSGIVHMNNYLIRAGLPVEQATEAHQELFRQCRMQFEAYCILNRKVHKKSDEIQNFAGFFNGKNHKKTFFTAWKQLTVQHKHIRLMDAKAERYKHLRTMRTCLKAWSALTIQSIKAKIKNEVLYKTEIEIAKVQADYEKIIASLEQSLEKKLLELRKQEEEHKLLHDKYEAMYSRSQA